MNSSGLNNIDSFRDFDNKTFTKTKKNSYLLPDKAFMQNIKDTVIKNDDDLRGHRTIGEDESMNDSFQSGTEVKLSNLYNQSTVMRKKLADIEQFKYGRKYIKLIRDKIYHRIAEVDK